MTKTVCYHCNDRIVGPAPCYAMIQGVEQPMCCTGCQCVAELIATSNLDDYYQLREKETILSRPDPTATVIPEAWRQLDEQYCSGPFELSIHIDNMMCSACAWLIEKKLTQNTALNTIIANHGSGDVYLSWDDPAIKPSTLLREIKDLGYVPSLSREEATDQAHTHYREQLKRLAVAGFGMMQVMTYSIGLYMGAFQGIDPVYERFFEWLSMLIATVVVTYSGQTFFSSALKHLLNKNWGMDVPISIAILGAYIASCFTLFTGSENDIYFDSAVMFIFFISISRLIEANIHRRAQSASKQVIDLLPKQVQIQRGDSYQIVAPQELQTRDQLSLSPQSTIAADGTLIDGKLWVDESILTGEALPICKNIGDALLAGSKVIKGTGILSVARPTHQSALANIQQLVNRAQTLKPTFGRFAEQLARYFVMFVLAITTLVGIGWMLYDPSMAFKAILATLVVSCPCALALAIPSTFISTTQALLRQGILVRDPRALEKMGRIDTVLFDKTGTLTSGQCELLQITPRNKLSRRSCERIAASLEHNQTHPLAMAFRHIQGDRPVNKLQAVDSMGIQGDMLGRHFRLGKMAWACYVQQAKTHRTEELEDAELALSMNGHLIATIQVDDRLKEDAPATMRWLEQKHLSTALLSGDGLARVRSIASQLGIQHYEARCTPEAKLSYLKDLRQSGKSVAMIGDGVNDAPVLSASDIAISMGKHSLIAQTHADFVFLNDKVLNLPVVFQAAKKCMRIAKQNAAWALAYNIVGIPLAASGILSPWLAALGMSVSSLIVVLNARRAGNLSPDTLSASKIDDSALEKAAHDHPSRSSIYKQVCTP